MIFPCCPCLPMASCVTLSLLPFLLVPHPIHTPLACDGACNIGLMRCFNRAATGCCNFYENNMCVGACTSPLVPDSNFDCKSFVKHIAIMTFVWSLFIPTHVAVYSNCLSHAIAWDICIPYSGFLSRVKTFVNFAFSVAIRERFIRENQPESLQHAEY